MAPGVGGGGRKDNRYSHCFIFTIIIFHVLYNIIFVLDLIKRLHLLENKHVWTLIGWK